MELGVCYYPEHWPETTWHKDAMRMYALGIRWVRIGEFSWSRLEPSPGKLEFAWLDKVFDTLAAAKLKIVLGTPTATPPKWLIDRYDDILPVDQEGRIRRFGSRRHYCFNSPSYLQETKRIVNALAERYATHEALEAWQTDNEYGCHDTVRCYCRNCKQAFQTWLKTRYKTPRALNQAHWNVFWSMEVQDFSEVELPMLAVTETNPSLVLDYYRFASDSLIAYNQTQISILRQHSDKPITHNLMLYFGNFDHFKLAQDLDFISWDNYPLGMLEQSNLPKEHKRDFLRVGDPDLISFMHDLYFGLKQKAFWVMEQQPGQVNWAKTNPLPAPGAVYLWSQQAFAHGAEVVSYFRWRAACGAQELMHAGLNLHDGSPDRASEEVKKVFVNLPSRADSPQPKLALLFDYENLWATQIQPHAQAWDYWSIVLNYYRALRSLGQDVAIVHPRHELNYKLVFAPALHLLDQSLAKHLEHYVAKGGQLILGPRSGYKTLNNTAHNPAPGPLNTLMGVEIFHLDALPPESKEHFSFQGTSYPYTIWADILSPTTAQVLAHYLCPAYAQDAAISEQAYGKGRCISIGMWADQTFYKMFFKHLLTEANIPCHSLAAGMRLSKRGSQNYLMNFNKQEQGLSPSLGFSETVIKGHSVLTKD